MDTDQHPTPYDPTMPVHVPGDVTGWIVMWQEPTGRLRLSEIFASCADAQQARFNPPESSWEYRATFFYTGTSGEQTFDC